MELDDIIALIKVKKDRCKVALESNGTPELLRSRVLHPQYLIYILALEGAHALKEKKKNQNSSDTGLVTHVAPLTL